MGVVYRSTHPRLEIPVAIKVLAEQYSSDANFRQRFHREAATVASLNHPGIVRVYDFDEDGPVLFIVMEWVEGRSMRSWLDEYGRFSVDVSVDLLQQLLSAVGVAHDLGVIHRDIKPDNILISNRGKTKIIDCGISKLGDDKQRLTATGSMVGTPAYMAPEQVKGETVDARADIYSLGMILYELLHGEPPFTGQLPAVLHSQVFDRPRPSTAIPSPIMEIIWRATAKDRAARFQSSEEFAGAFHYMPKPAAAQPPMEAVSNEVEMVEQVEHRVAIPADARGSKPPGVCLHTDCQERRGWACAYKDLMGRECKSWWCRRHITFIERTPFCPRHASVIRALAPTAGTIFEIKNRPAVDDRALPLAALVAEDIDKDVTELVRRRYQNRKDVVLATDKTVRQTWAGRTEVAWERSWAALKSQGYLIRIAIRVSVAEPDHVQLLIGNTVVFKEVPDWIHRRREGKPTAHDNRAAAGAHGLRADQAGSRPERGDRAREHALRRAGAGVDVGVPHGAGRGGQARHAGHGQGQHRAGRHRARARRRRGRARGGQLAILDLHLWGARQRQDHAGATHLGAARRADHHPGRAGHRRRRGEDRLRRRSAPPGVEPADRQALAPHRAPDGAGRRRVPARDVRPDLRGRQPYLRSASAGEGQRRRAVDRRSRSPARRAEADPRPPAGASGAGERLHEPCQQRAQGRDSVLGPAGAVDDTEARRSARRGLLAAVVVHGPDARPDVGHVGPHLRAGAGAADDSAEPFGAGLDPQHVRRPAAARQPPARPPRTVGGRVVRPRAARGAQPGARP